MRIFFITISTFTVLLLLVAAVASGNVWIFDLAANGALYLVLLLCACILFFCVYRDWKPAFVFGIFLIAYSATFVFPITLFSTPVSHVPKNPDLFFMNTLFYNDKPKEIIASVKTLQPKTVAVVEVNKNLIAGLTKQYGEPLMYHDDVGLSCAIFSTQVPVSSFVAHETYPLCIAEFSDYALIVIHPVPPYTDALLQVQKQYFDDVQKYVQQYQDRGVPIVIAGDFNSTWFSKTMRSRWGVYKMRSFLSWHANSFITLPLDHIIPVGKTITQTYMLPAMGSDHFGIVAFF